MSLQIGLLQCDHVADDLINIHGNYPKMFEEMLLAVDPDIEMAVYDLTNNLFPVDLNACDAYIITGSQFSAYDDIPWINKAKQLVTDLYQAKIPTIGICFGHQLIAESLGGKVDKASDKGWGVGVHHWQVKENSEWMVTESPKAPKVSTSLKRLKSFALRASHQDQVTKLPSNAKLFARSDFCPIAGFQIDDHILSFQGHPEFSKAYAKALIKKRVKRIGEKASQKAVKSLKQETHSETVGAWIVNFIRTTTKKS